MITKAHRFHGLASLRYVYSRGQTVRGPVLAVKYLLNPRRSSYRAAVVVSRKVHKSAVVRNRIRRRIYEVIRSLEPKITGPYDIVVTIYSESVADMPARDVRAQVQSQFRKAAMLGVVSSQARPSDTDRGRAIVEQKESD